jgi:hypothetical protein
MIGSRKKSKKHHIYVDIGEIIIPDGFEQKRPLFRIKRYSLREVLLYMECRGLFKLNVARLIITSN